MKVPFGCQRCGGLVCLNWPEFKGKTLEECWRQPEEMKEFIKNSEHCLAQFRGERLSEFVADFEKLGRLVA